MAESVLEIRNPSELCCLDRHPTTCRPVAPTAGLASGNTLLLPAFAQLLPLREAFTHKEPQRHLHPNVRRSEVREEGDSPGVRPPAPEPLRGRRPCRHLGFSQVRLVTPELPGDTPVLWSRAVCGDTSGWRCGELTQSDVRVSQAVHSLGGAVMIPGPWTVGWAALQPRRAWCRQKVKRQP